MNSKQELGIIATAMTDMLTATAKLGKELENLDIEKELIVQLTGACAQVEAISLKILLDGDAFDEDEKEAYMLVLEKAIRASISASMCLDGEDARKAMTVDLGDDLNTFKVDEKEGDKDVDKLIDSVLDNVVEKLIDKYGDELEDALDGKNKKLAKEVEKDVFDLLKKSL